MQLAGIHDNSEGGGKKEAVAKMVVSIRTSRSDILNEMEKNSKFKLIFKRGVEGIGVVKEFNRLGTMFGNESAGRNVPANSIDFLYYRLSNNLVSSRE